MSKNAFYDSCDFLCLCINFITVSNDKASEINFESEDPVVSSGTMIKLRWSPEAILPVVPADSYRVDITLREFNETSQEWVFTDIAKDLPNTGYVEVVAPEFVSPENYNDTVTSAVIQIGVSESTSEVRTVKRGIFSNLFKVIKKAVKKIVKFTVKLIKAFFVDPLLRVGCEVWGAFQSSDNAQQILASLPPCSCTVSEIREQGNTFEEEDNKFINFFHPGSATCFRERKP